MKKAIIYLSSFELMQARWGRKWMKGTYYFIDPQGLRMAPFWSDRIISSCQSKVIKVEKYKE